MLNPDQFPSSNAEHLTHPKYRPDIDGLRAIAVLAVVIFHAFPKFIKGGFIGVDIFFVISGFLISTIIFGSLDRNSFSFLEFYSRRIRRIFPALLLVLITCFLFGWFALFADEYKQLGQHIAGGASFISNFLFWNESGYFDNAAETKPLLHLWSLGIEEQFYIVWPLLLWFAWKRKFNLLTITICIAAISFLLNVSTVSKDVNAAFYSPQTRFWELLIGSSLAYMTHYKLCVLPKFKKKLNILLNQYVYKQKLASNSKTLNDVQSLIGVVFIVIGFAVITKKNLFPGWWAILPTFGTLLIISAGVQAWFNRVVLSNPVLVWFGVISFPLYLWHWPLISFARIVENGTPSRQIMIVVIIISISLAWLTYKLIEKPMRFGKYRYEKTITLAVLMSILGCIGYITYKKDGFEFRESIKAYGPYGEYGQLLNDVKKPRATRESDGSCSSMLGLAFSSASEIQCLTNSVSPEILIVGDSHAMALNSAAFLNKIEAKTLLIASHACLPFQKQVLTDKIGTKKTCNDLFYESLDIAKKFDSIKTILVSTRGAYYYSGHGYGALDVDGFYLGEYGNKSGEMLFYEGYLNYISKLVALNKKVIFVNQVPELGVYPKSCISLRPFHITDKVIASCTNEKKEVISRQQEYRKIVDKLKLNIPNLLVFDPTKYFCDDTTCYGKMNNRMLYWDDDHISVKGSEILLREVLKI